MSSSRHHSKKVTPLIAALLAVIIGVGLFALYYWEKQEQSVPLATEEPIRNPQPADALTVFHNGATYTLRSDLETILLMGIDKTSDRMENLDSDALLNNLQSDFLMLLVVDKTASSVTAVHLNRDTMAETPRIGREGKTLAPVTEQLALSHTYGTGGKDSCRNTVKAVSRLLYDVPIDHYLALTMDAIPALTDFVGGVTVHIDDDLTAADPSFVQGTDVTLQGDRALTFVRARRSVTDGTNLSRMERQRTFINALYLKLRSSLNSGGESYALRLSQAIAPYTTSDLSTDDLVSFTQSLSGYSFAGIETTPGTPDMGAKYIEFHPDEQALQALVIRLFFTKS